ncbi:MAG TPA: tetratricopeptide repeat protein, partial [Nitrospira sp.]
MYTSGIFLQRHRLASLLTLFMWIGLGTDLSIAKEASSTSERQVAEEAKAAWESGAIPSAFDILEQGIHDHPDAVVLQKLRGDILATSRGPTEASEAYDRVLAAHPASLVIRWAKWSVLVRSGQADRAIAELQHIAEIDGRNPLIHLLLAQELRKVDRLEESLRSYEKAVELVPDFLGWRLALARARFDVLDYQGADRDVQYVLERAPAGSPLELPARTFLSVVRGSSQDRGRRFEPVFTPDEVAPAELKEWALIRADAWRLFIDGHYAEAEPIYRRMLALNPTDIHATHQFALTLMQLDRCSEALAIFGRVLNLDPSSDHYADTVYRMGQCMVELGQWEEAFVHFQTLYDAAVEFEEKNKDAPLPPETRVLDKAKLSRWLEKVRPHVPELTQAKDQESVRPAQPAPPVPEEELFAKAVEKVKPHKPLEPRASLVGRDADFSWFRFVIPASKVMRDDFPTGAHEFIPLNPNDSFF